MSKILLVLLLAIGACSVVYSENITIASDRGPGAGIVCTSNDKLMRKTADWCRGFLSERAYKVEKSISRSLDEGASPAWVLEIKSNCPIAKSLGVDISRLDSARADAYILTITNGDRPTVSIVGRNVQGVRSGVARLVALMSEGDGKLFAPRTNEFRTPFFPIRRIMVCTTGRIVNTPEACKQYGYPATYTAWNDTLWTNWSDARIRDYAEQLWLYGFNSVELCEIRGYRGVFNDEQLKNEITPKLRVFMQACHDNGLEVSQFIWGQSLFVEGENLCWNEPNEHKQMEAEYRRLAQTYGDLVDHIVVHVGDPGGCHRNGCDAYKTTQELATSLHSEYRKVNPNVTCTLSTWANKNFWKGRNGDKFLDEKHSDDEVAIALHRWYDPKQAKQIRESGRECDIWGWYLSDYELHPDMALLMRRLDNMFNALPDQASKDVRAISTELCFQGWPHVINAYVSAQKMWSPKRPLADIEREFCAGTFGDRNTDGLMRMYNACEEYVHPERYYGFISPSECLPVVFGTPEYNKRIRQAMAARKHTNCDDFTEPRMTNSTNGRALFDYLNNNLSLIHIYSEAQEQVNRAKASGAGESELKKIVDEANKQSEPYKNDPDHPWLARALASSIKTEK